MSGFIFRGQPFSDPLPGTLPAYPSPEFFYEHDDRRRRQPHPFEESRAGLYVRRRPPYSHCLSLDGTSYLKIGSPTVLASLDSTLSMSCWARMGGMEANSASVIFGSLSTGLGAGSATIGLSQQQLIPQICGLPVTYSQLGETQFSQPIDTGWHHYVVTYDAAGNITSFVDGVPIAVQIGAPAPTSVDWIIGAMFSAVGPPYLVMDNFRGQISDCRVWQPVLTQANVLALYNGGRGLPVSLASPAEVGWWPLVNVPFADLSGNSNTATPVGSVKIVRSL
jgi:hypothetical protein